MRSESGTAEEVIEFAETIHRIFRASSALEQGNHEAKDGARRLSISTVVNKTSN